MQERCQGREATIEERGLGARVAREAEVIWLPDIGELAEAGVVLLDVECDGILAEISKGGGGRGLACLGCALLIREVLLAASLGALNFNNRQEFRSPPLCLKH